MKKSDSAFAISEEGQEVARLVDIELLDSLRKDLPQAQNTSFVLAARNNQDSLLGGLTASTSYGWLLIKTLWVDGTYQRQGIGSALVEFAHDKARTIGCHGAWLDTSSPAAMQFYSGLGYSVFGELSNSTNQFPADHRRWFMQASL